MNLTKSQYRGQWTKILYTTNEQLKIEIENIIYNDIKKHKDFSLDLHTESNNTLLREIRNS